MYLHHHRYESQLGDAINRDFHLHHEYIYEIAEKSPQQNFESKKQ
jgi:hypothetical protein